MENRPATANLMKKKYCLGDSSQCARYIVFKSIGKDYVPGNLFPSQTERIEEILSLAKKPRG
jgi:hypothetical protein